MYPHGRSLVKKLADKPFALIGVNSDSDLEAIRKTVADKNLNWRSFWNGPEGLDGPISTKWNIHGWPTIFILDEHGVIRYKDVRGHELEKAITSLLAEMEESASSSNQEPTGKPPETSDDKEQT